jgi:hypothetical protein
MQDGSKDDIQRGSLEILESYRKDACILYTAMGAAIKDTSS